MHELLQERIRRLVAKSQMSANKVSILAGLDRGYVGKLGKPKGESISEPGAYKLVALAEILKVPASWLFDAIAPDEAEVARGADWPVPGDGESSPQLREFAKDTDELALLAFWRSLETDEHRHMALASMKGMALDRRLGGRER